MNYLHYELQVGSGDVVEVTLDSAANVQILDAANYDHYRNGRAYRYTGGYVETSPCRLKPPRPGSWHLVIDLGGYSGNVRAGARVIRAVPA